MKENYTYSITDGKNTYIGEGKTLEEAQLAAQQAKESVELSDEFDFGTAIHLLKAGEKVARKGWNGKGMFLLLVKGETVSNAIDECYGNPEKPKQSLPVLDAIYMKTADNKLVPWLASQTDVLAEDWQSIE